MKQKIMPPTVLGICLLLQIVFHYLLPVKEIVVTPYNYLGVIFILIGFTINVWADALFKKAKTTVKPGETTSEMITSGPFCISRHPMYLGMLLILLGTALVMGSVIVFLVPVVFVMIIQLFFVGMEERSMERAFGDAYLQYKKRVRQWI